MTPASQAQDDPIRAYLELLRRRPELAATDEGGQPLCLDEAELRAFQARTGKAMGLVYDNWNPVNHRSYYMLLSDLVQMEGHLQSYTRVVFPRAITGTVALCRRQDGRFGLIRIFRHPLRGAGCLLEIPRGHLEVDLTPEENCRREIQQEIHAQVLSLQELGSTAADSGLISGSARVYLAEVGGQPGVCPGYEGISSLVWMTMREIREAIGSGRITDGYTQAAVALYLCRDGAADEAPE
jgi:8-oxo-dGTP pyrophosphatase MutT (NUDIX family)